MSKLISKSKFIITMAIVLALISLPLLNSNVAYADGDGSTGIVDNVVINRNGQMIIVVMGGADGYGMAYSAKNQLYDYLKGSGSTPIIYALQSGTKFMVLSGGSGYAFNYSAYPNAGAAMQATAAIPQDEVNTYFIFEGFDGLGQAILTPVLAPVTGPTVSDISFGGVAQTIGTDNTITVVVNPTDVYNTASVTLSKKARVTVSNAAGTKTKTALVEAGIMDGTAAINAFTLASDSATGQKLIDEGTITVTLVAVDANDDDIPAETTVYTVNFVAAN